MKGEQNEERLLDHSYDGIQEYDNPLPRWWVWIFYATILYSVIYVFDFTGRIGTEGRITEYDAELAAAAQRWPAPAGGADSATLAALVSSPAAIADGQKIFQTTCASCHGPDGGGIIGPNLADEYWLHGASAVEIHRTIADGVVDKGMPAWGKMLSPGDVDNVTAYVASLRGTSPSNPKPPQGNRVGTGADFR
jgi:cytochrome c oxidase cbb3-type subunit 3